MEFGLFINSDANLIIYLVSTRTMEDWHDLIAAAIQVGPSDPHSGAQPQLPELIRI